MITHTSFTTAATQLRVWVATATTVVVAVSMMTALAPSADAVTLRKAPPTQITTPVSVSSVPTRGPVQDAVTAPAPARVAAPHPATATVTQQPKGGAKTTDVGGLPVALSTPDPSAAATPLQVSTLDPALSQRLGIDGPVVQLQTPGGGTAPTTGAMTVGYGAYAGLSGGDWASRLHVVAVPPCAMQVPVPAGCALIPVPSTNNPATQTLTVAVADLAPGTSTASPAPSTRTSPTPPRQAPGASAQDPAAAKASPTPSSSPSATTFAVAAAPAGGAGSYTATPLTASSTWTGGGQTGDFTWSYPLKMPTGAGGPVPKLAVSYSSGSVDGRTSSTNNQPSWLGEGHDLGAGFVERKYVPCADDMAGGNNTVKTGDLCWSTDNATLSLAGHSSELVRDGATGTWRPKHEDGSRIEKLTGASNGDNDTEYWKVTTPDGTQYFFGLGKRSPTDTENTNSTWTVPVFGNQPGEPCHAAAFADSSCAQGWRWNLDYVVDPNANTMTYYYATETNNYGRNLNAAVSTYTRSGYLTRIDYNERRGNDITTTAPARTVFTVAERCLASGSITCDPAQLTAANAQYWPDVPQDQICTSTTSCPSQLSPTFFTRKRLTGVTTQVLSGSAYSDVDNYTFVQEFKDPGDGTSKSLWLSAIQHTGSAGGTPIATPDVTFVGTQLANRVDGIDVAPPLIKWRVSAINTDTGSTISVLYSSPDCTPSSLPASPETDTRRCFPVYWAAEGQSEPRLNYFHKYVVTAVSEADRTGGGVAKQTSYDYGGSPAWHYDDTSLIPVKYRTYGQWRGYSSVDVRTGGSGEAQTRDHTLFMQGMDGDKLPTGTRSVSVTDSQGATLTDSDQLSGFVREHITYNGTGGAEINGTVNDPWISAPTATDGTITARYAKIAATRTRTALAAGGNRTTATSTTYDELGMPTQVNDLGDTTTAADDLCTTTSYIRNPTLGIIDRTLRIETTAKACGAAVNRPADVVTDQRISYDGAAAGVAPTRGNATRTEVVGSYNAGTAVYVTSSTADYDAQGRVTSDGDALDRKTTTAFTPATGAPVTSTAVTNALGHTTTSTLEPAHGQPTATVDANNHRTDVTYDALGRTTAVWKPDRSKSAGATASLTFGYVYNGTDPVATSTQTLRYDGRTYTTAWTLYDGLLRPRQTQTPAPGANGGRIITETLYDTHGWATEANGPLYNGAAPAATLVTAPANTIPSRTVTTYDGAGRATVKAFTVNGAEKWRTTTSYGGDRITVTPPAGDTPTTTLTDARGRTTELDQYQGAGPTGAFDVTTYTYTAGSDLTAMTDPVGNQWTYSYDLRHRRTATTDPDKGTSTSTYDTAGQLTTSTDARGVTLATTYDTLGRKTSLRDSSTTGPVRATFTYDTLAKGLPTSSTRTDNGNTYTQAVTSYDALNRPLGTSTTIPTSEGALAGTYTSTTTYNIDGTPRRQVLPTVPGLSAETLSFGYDALADPNSLTGRATYVAGTTYSPYGETLQHSMGNYQLAVYNTYNYEEGTRRLQSQQLDRQTAPTTDSTMSWTYDAAGNTTTMTDTTPTVTDTQCFTYDYLRRLTQAWTPPSTTPCATAPDATTLAGAAPYWDTYTYDKIGNRLTNTARTPQTTTNTTSTYPNPGAGAVRPHTPTSTTSSGPGAVNGTTGYDNAGNTTARPTTTGNQTLTWTPEGQIGTVTDPTGTTSYTYDANGQRLLRRDATGTTLYVGNDEIRLTTSSGTAATTRYYTYAGRTVALRTNDTTYAILTPDNHGTATYAVDESTNQPLTTRRSQPFGEARGTQPTNLAGSKGFVGGTQDPTGLTQLGARPYDPTAGRFLAVDPLQDLHNPQQWNAYAYSNNNPTTFSDPTGLMANRAYAGSGGQSAPPIATVSGPWFDGIVSALLDPPPPSRPTIQAPLPYSGSYSYGHNYSAPKQAPAQDNRSWLERHSNAIHIGLGVISVIPVVGSFAAGADGAIYLVEGDKLNAALSFAAAVPLEGNAVAAGRLAVKAGEEIRAAELGAKAAQGGAASVRLGQAGEAAVRAQYDIGLKASEVINGRKRIFDGLNGGAVSEVKNVGRLSNTRQLRDYADYADDNGLNLDIYVRENTQISGPLARLDLDPSSPVNIIRALP